MSDVPLSAEARRWSPLLSVWGAPRDSIERVVAGPPNHLVLLFAVLGGAASAVNVLCGYGVGAGLLDWQALLGCLVGGGGLSIVNLYITAFIVSWMGRRMGGDASAATVRAAFAWSMLPVIVWLVLALLVAGVLRSGAIMSPKLLPRLLYLLGTACSIWSMIVALLMLGRVERFGFWRTVLVYMLGMLGFPALLALVIRTFLFQPFNVPSGSNMPTLLVGDYVFATKYAYGYSQYSLPFSPALFSGRILAAEPARGDVVVFRLKDGETDSVKRLIGLPGDRVQMRSGQLYINDMPVQHELTDDFVGPDACGTEAVAHVKRWRETLPNGVSYETLDCVDNGFYDTTNVYTVPAGHYFMLGDNRDNSTDSRMSAFGYIPLENLIGRVGMIFFSYAADGVTPPSIRYERIGMVVR